MPLNPTTFTVKDAAAADKSMVAYNDGSKNAFAHAVLDSDGALMNPATAGKQDTGNASLATVATGIGAPADAAASSDTGTFALIALIKRLLTRTPALGSATSSNSTPVVIASDQASLPLPTGASTAANQSTGNTTLATIATNTGRIPAQGAALAAASTPVAVATDQLSTLATAANQVTTNTALTTIGTNTGTTATGIGAPADAAASSDTGTFGVIAFIKRSMQNWTTLLSRVPALVSGRIPVDGSAVTQPVSAASLPLPAGAATSANQSLITAEIGKLYQPRSVSGTYDGGANMTRPANTTAYAFGDLVGSDASTPGNNKVWVIPFCRANDTPGQITGGKLFKSSTGITSAAFRIYIFRNTFTIAQNDNAAFILPAKADILGILTGSIDEVCADGAYGIFVPKQNVTIPAIPASGTQNIFAIIEAVDAYTPVSGEQFGMTLEGFA